MSVRYEFAILAGLRRVGMWTADAAVLAMGPELAEEMWAAVPHQRPC